MQESPRLLQNLDARGRRRVVVVVKRLEDGKYQAHLRLNAGSDPMFFSRREQSSSNAKRAAESMFGKLIWDEVPARLKECEPGVSRSPISIFDRPAMGTTLAVGFRHPAWKSGIPVAGTTTTPRTATNAPQRCYGEEVEDLRKARFEFHLVRFREIFALAYRVGSESITIGKLDQDHNN